MNTRAPVVLGSLAAGGGRVNARRMFRYGALLLKLDRIPPYGSDDANFAVAVATIYRALGPLWGGYSFDDLLRRAWPKQSLRDEVRRVANRALRTLKARDRVGFDAKCNEWFSIQRRRRNEQWDASRSVEWETARTRRVEKSLEDCGTDAFMHVLFSKTYFREWLFKAVAETVWRDLSTSEIFRLVGVVNMEAVRGR